MLLMGASVGETTGDLISVTVSEENSSFVLLFLSELLQGYRETIGPTKMEMAHLL
jgi:hypothetical protein